MVFNIETVPFSYKGSGLALCDHEGTDGLALTDVTGKGMFGNGALFNICYFQDNDTVNPEAKASPEKALLYLDSAIIAEACFESETTFRLQGSCDTLKLLADTNWVIKKEGENNYYFQRNFKFGTSRYIVYCNNGRLIYQKHNWKKATLSLKIGQIIGLTIGIPIKTASPNIIMATIRAGTMALSLM